MNAISPILDANPDMRKQIAPEHREKFLNVLCQHLDMGISIMDEDLNYQFISDGVYKQLKISPEDLTVGDPLSKCHDLMIKNGTMTPKIIAKNELSADEEKTNRNHGEPRKRKLVRMADGTVHYFIRKTLPSGFTLSMAEDVTELVEKETILERSLSIGQAGYWIYNLKTKKYQLSKSLKHYFGEEGVKKIKKNGILSIVEDEDKGGMKAALKNMKQTNGRFEVECRTMTRNGNIRWNKTNAELICDPMGRPQQLWAFVKDTTREKRQEVALEEAMEDAIAASRAKSEFLANMSHEIRTPMNGIIGMAELLANSEIDDRQRDFLNVINNSASALLTIINDILDFSKIEAGALKLDPMPFDLKTAISDVISLLKTSAQEKGIEIIVNYPSRLPNRFIGDGGRIRQILTNLIGNAIKFTKEGHVTVLVSIEHSEDKNSKEAFVRLDIQDTGIGIPQDKLTHIFDKFTQADGSTTRVYGGTGLGLAITKKISEMMGGSVELTSEFGVGSTFSSKVQLTLDEQIEAPKLDNSPLIGTCALVVDDIDVNRQIFTEQLKSWGIEVHTAADGLEGLKAIKNGQDKGLHYDFVILDYLMPGINGIELAKMLSHHQTLKCPPLIMLSSCEQAETTTELNKANIRSYHLKPLRDQRLREIILEVLAEEEEEVKKIESASSRHGPIAPVTVVNNVGAHQGQAAPQRMPAPPKTDFKPVINAKTPILVAEDFPLNQDVVRLMLSDSNFEPNFVNNGQEAVNAYKQNPHKYPVIVMDVSMPVMDGHEASRQIIQFEKDNNLPHTPIIALTGHAMKHDREACLEAGMDDFLTKPVKQAELHERLVFQTTQLENLARSA